MASAEIDGIGLDLRGSLFKYLTVNLALRYCGLIYLKEDIDVMYREST